MLGVFWSLAAYSLFRDLYFVIRNRSGLRSPDPAGERLRHGFDA
jgi:hypothetical protein